MSMGPTKKESFGLKISDQVKGTVTSITKGYFEKPLYYLFYIMLSATVVALFFNRHLPWQFYLLLGILGIFELSRILEVLPVTKKLQEKPEKDKK